MTKAGSTELIVQSTADRLDVFLSENIPGLTRAKARELCEKRKVEVNGRTGRAGQALLPGDTVTLSQSYVPVRATPERAADAELLFFEDDALLVVNKPRGMASVRLRAEDPPTLADWVAAHCPACVEASPDPREAGLVQRLDFSTSGLVLAAKSRAVWEALRKQLFAEEVEKSYLALVEKRPVKKRFTVSFPLVQSKDGKSMCAVRDGGDRATIQLSAVTDVTVLNEIGRNGRGFALVRAKGRRVRRHQIRAHLAASSHPLVGDVLYGSTATLGEVFPDSPGLDGFLLHAESIQLRHPSSGRDCDFRCPSPLCEELQGEDDPDDGR